MVWVNGHSCQRAYSYWYYAAVAEMLVALRSPRLNSPVILFGPVFDQPNRRIRTRMYGGVGGALSDGRPYPDVCRVRHVFLRVSMYISYDRYITSPRPSLMEAKGVAVWQLGGSIDTRRESRSAEAEHRKCTGRRNETESGWSGGTSPQHRIKSSIHRKPGRYTRRSCAERCVFTPGELPRVRKD